jgi:hypothetical protein
MRPAETERRFFKTHHQQASSVSQNENAGDKAPVVVSINITCFGLDEQKNHVLVGELLRHAMNCVV